MVSFMGNDLLAYFHLFARDHMCTQTEICHCKIVYVHIKRTVCVLSVSFMTPYGTFRKNAITVIYNDLADYSAAMGWRCFVYLRNLWLARAILLLCFRRMRRKVIERERSMSQSGENQGPIVSVKVSRFLSLIKY